MTRERHRLLDPSQINEHYRWSGPSQTPMPLTDGHAPRKSMNTTDGQDRRKLLYPLPTAFPSETNEHYHQRSGQSQTPMALIDCLDPRKSMNITDGLDHRKLLCPLPTALPVANLTRMLHPKLWLSYHGDLRRIPRR